jgi:branched-chain amino acid transport system ATP-binding protein
MTQALLKVHSVTRRFGGLVAVDKVSFDVVPGEVLTIIGPNGAGKSTLFNVISRIYPESSGQLFFEGVDLGQVAPYQIANLGIARTFQNIELFEHATVLQNLLIGHHSLSRTSVLSNLFFLKSTRQEELASRARIEEVIDFLGLQKYRDSYVSGLPYGCLLYTSPSPRDES